MSHGSSRASSPWIDFYHLSASAARYLSAKGKMHPSGFDTRAVASDEASTFLAVAGGSVQSSADDRLRDLLDANSFISKMRFVRDVLNSWVQFGRLGGRPTPTDVSGRPSEIFWDGAQERSSTGSGGKYVWVTVGAQGGDGDYVCIAPNLQTDQEARKAMVGQRPDRGIDSSRGRSG